jgi:predicted DNA-binding transcriptional regulator YafY
MAVLENARIGPCRDDFANEQVIGFLVVGFGDELAGEPGIGYILKPGYLLPPLMFSQDEMEALMLGIRWVSTFADQPLALAAIDAQAKIEEVLPREIREGLGAVPLRVGPAGPAYPSTENLSDLRDAIRRERKLEICYLSEGGQESKRVIWPFAIGYFTHGRILVGWCETRNAYRHFRTDRLLSACPKSERYPAGEAKCCANGWHSSPARHPFRRRTTVPGAHRPQSPYQQGLRIGQYRCRRGDLRV